jgi:feruloyl-CoA synthase
MAATARLMAEVGPTLHIAVPLGLKFLIDACERDPATALAATRNLRAIFFAGAGIDAPLWARLRAWRDRLNGFEILSGYGATEAASTICLSPAPLEAPGELGFPLPGHEIALVETEDRLELRVRGPNITPGYIDAEGLAPPPLDEHGFYRTGDAARLRARADSLETLAFDGRLGDDFKLTSGTKVRAGPLRARLIAHCAPLLDDIVIEGENRESLVAILFPAAGAGSALAERLAAWNAENPASSTRIARFAIADAPPSRENGEVSDKHQIVRSRYLRNHAAVFAALREKA